MSAAQYGVSAFGGIGQQHAMGGVGGNAIAVNPNLGQYGGSRRRGGSRKTMGGKKTHRRHRKHTFSRKHHRKSSKKTKVFSRIKRMFGMKGGSCGSCGNVGGEGMTAPPPAIASAM